MNTVPMRLEYHKNWEGNKKGDKKFVTVQLTHPVTHASINAAMDKANKKYKKDFPYLHSYGEIVTDEKEQAFCWKCRKEFTYNTVYGFAETYCPYCHSSRRVATQGGHPHKDKMFDPNTKCTGKFWLKSTRRIHAEATAMTYECSGCGEKDFDVFD